MTSSHDASVFYAKLDSLRRAHDAYQARGHRRYDPIAELAAAEVAARAEEAANGASLLWNKMLTDITATLGHGALLSRAEFKKSRGELMHRHHGTLVSRALRRLTYVQDFTATYYTEGHDGPSAGIEASVMDWHRFRMWAIHTTAGSSRRVAEPTRSSAHYLHQTSAASAYLAAVVAAAPDDDLRDVVRTVLRVPPHIGP